MSQSRIHALIVEDDASVAKSLQEIVQRMGAQVTVVSNPEDALNTVKIKPVQLAIVDCMLPKMNGVELVKKLRTTRFQQAPAILISGIFRDKGFAKDAMQKTGAVEFLFKPIDAKALKEALGKIIKPEEEKSDKVSLYALLTRNYSSRREKLKAFEQFDEVQGFDLAILVTFLMDFEVSGHLNMSSSNGEIYGLSFEEGDITQLDSGASAKILKELLIKKGFLTETEYSRFKETHKRGDLVAGLIKENLLSPHALKLIKAEQIKTELNQIFSEKTVNINFVPDESGGRPSIIDFETYIDFLHEAALRFSGSYLKELYSSGESCPLRRGANFARLDEVLAKPLGQPLAPLKAKLNAEVSLKDLLESSSGTSEEVLRAIHFLILLRVLVIDDRKQEWAQGPDLTTINKMIGDLKGKNPFELFIYFGAGPQLRPPEVEKIYKDFAKANHPDHLPPKSPEEVLQKSTQLFALVSEAYTILMDPVKREKAHESVQERELKAQVAAETLLDDGIRLIKQNQFDKAAVLFAQSLQHHFIREAQIHYVWARLKSPSANLSGDDLAEMSDKLYEVPVQERRNYLYCLVMGLLKKAQGDISGAIAQMTKAQQFDPNSLDVRRELVALSGKKKSGEITGVQDLLSGDLSQIVGSLFGRRKS